MATTRILPAMVLSVSAWALLAAAGCEQRAGQRQQAGEHARPAVFADLSVQDAKQRAAAEKKLLVVDAMAEWCPPCKAMDADTWVEPGLVAWLNEHAIAVQLDVDRDSSTAQDLRVRAMPTIIAFRDGQEVSRVVGYRNAEQMKEWLGGL